MKNITTFHKPMNMNVLLFIIVRPMRKVSCSIKLIAKRQYVSKVTERFTDLSIATK